MIIYAAISLHSTFVLELVMKWLSKRPLGGDGDKFRMPDLSLNFTCSFSNPHLLFTSLTCCISPHHR
jgi:hypothetical protein